MDIRIDCGRVSAVDISGLQLLDVWIQCAKFRGLEPELVKLPGSLQQALQKIGLRHCFTNKNAHSENPDVIRTVSSSGKIPFRAEYINIQP